MSNVSINNPVNPTITTTTSTTGGGTTTTTGTQDSIGSSSSVNPFNQLAASNGVSNSIILDTPIYIGDYVLTVGSAVDAHKAQQTLSQIVNSDIFSQFALGLLDKSQLIAAISKAVSILGQEIEDVENKINQDITDLQNQISATNTTLSNNNTQNIIDDYNTAVDDAKSAYNTAIAAALQISNSTARAAAIAQANSDYQTAVNNAISTYNAAATAANAANASAITDLNNAVDTFLANQIENNQTIADINDKLKALGLNSQKLPLEDYTVNHFSFTLQTGLSPITQSSTAHTATPAPTLHPSSVPDASTVNPNDDFALISPVQTSVDFVQKNFNTILSNSGINSDTNTFADSYNTAQTISNQQANKTVGTKIYLPDSYVSQHPVLATFSVTNAGGGSALVDVATAGSTQGHPAAVSKALLKALSFLGDMDTLLTPIEALSIFTTELAKTGGLLASLPALPILGAAALSSADNNMAFGIAFGISNGQALANLIQSGVIENTVRQSLEAAAPGADAATLDKAVAIATAIIQQDLVATALAQASNDFGTPGLIGQVLGNASSATASQLAQASATPPSLADTLSDTSNQLFLKSYLTTALAALNNGSQTVLGTLINQTINTAISNQINTEADLQNALIKAFSQTSLTSQEQSTLIGIALAIVKAEQNANQVLSSDLLDKKISEEILAKLLLQANIAQADRVAQDAIKKVLENISITNNEQYRLDLEAALKAQGLKEDLAKQIAQATVDKASADNSALLNPLFVNPTPLPTLAEQIHNYVFNTLSNVLDPIKAQEVAHSAVATFIGTPEERAQQISANAPPSLLEIYQNSQQVLDGYGVSPTLAYFVNDSIKKTDDALFSLNMIHEPGKLLLHSSWSSIMSTGVAGDTSSSLPVPGRGTINPVSAV